MRFTLILYIFETRGGRKSGKAEFDVEVVTGESMGIPRYSETEAGV